MSIPIPALFPFPIRQVPTWAIINTDDPLSLPLMGQFNTPVTWVGGKPIWAERPAIAGGQSWLQYIGEEASGLQFTFHAIANDIWDQYPAFALARLKELASRDASLGRPPLLMFVHGLTITQGYITTYGDPEIQYWQHDNLATSRLIREVGPFQVTLKIAPGKEVELPLGTTYVLHTGSELNYEELGRDKFGSALFGAAIREYNQGAVEGDQVQVPRKQNPMMKKYVSVCPYFDTDDVIEGL